MSISFAAAHLTPATTIRRIVRQAHAPASTTQIGSPHPPAYGTRWHQAADVRSGRQPHGSPHRASRWPLAAHILNACPGAERAAVLALSPSWMAASASRRLSRAPTRPAVGAVAGRSHTRSPTIRALHGHRRTPRDATASCRQHFVHGHRVGWARLPRPRHPQPLGCWWVVMAVAVAEQPAGTMVWRLAAWGCRYHGGQASWS
jgi:hypothetical protein